MEAWGFKYLAPIHWVKPSGVGNYVIHRTQTVLLGYKPPCKFERKRYFPNVVIIPKNPPRHSEKPPEFYELIEQVSPPARLELFARKHRPGWDVWGNEVNSSITFAAMRIVAPLAQVFIEAYLDAVNEHGTQTQTTNKEK